MTTNGLLRGGASTEPTNGHYSNGSSAVTSKSSNGKSKGSAPSVWYLDSGFWRRFVAVAVVLPMTVLNIVSMTVSNDESRQLLKLLDSNLGVRLTEVNYAIDCSQIWDKVMDPFMPCHFIGWLLATISLRDWKVVCGFFMIDEMLEIWWAPMYPNFAECWWDAIILDILVCNLLGALAGQAILRWLGWQERDFFKGVSKDPYRLAFILHIIGSRIIGFMALFGWKNVMWVPSSHWTNILRMVCYVMAGDVAFEEAYYWLEGKHTKRKGRDFWMMFYWIFVFIEFAHTYKMGYCDPIWELSSDWQRVMAVVLMVLQLFSFLVLPIFQPLVHYSPAKAVKTM